MFLRKYLANTTIEATVIGIVCVAIPTLFITPGLRDIIRPCGEDS